jgi:alkane 1-monooxygenase
LRKQPLALRFGVLNALTLALIVALVLGGFWIWLVAGFAIFGVAILDELAGIHGEPSEVIGGWHYDIELYATLPLLLIVTLLFLHYVIKTDPLGVIHGLSLLGLTFGGAAWVRNGTAVVGATFATGLFYALVGMVVAHELMHRTNSTLARHVSRMLLALNHNTHFATTHLYGHHRNVATFDDPASARRGEYVLAFIHRCILGEIREALAIEKQRLRKKRLSYVSWHNRVLQDQLYSLGLIAAVTAIAGYRALVAFLIVGSLGGGIQRLFDYVFHYGLVRVPGAPIEARHSWECDHALTKATQYNLALHPDHHLNAGKPYWELRPRSDAPRLPCSFTTAALTTLFPPLWHRLIDPLLLDWDQRLANDEERSLVSELYPEFVGLQKDSTTFAVVTKDGK